MELQSDGWGVGGELEAQAQDGTRTFTFTEKGFRGFILRGLSVSISPQGDVLWKGEIWTSTHRRFQVPWIRAFSANGTMLVEAPLDAETTLFAPPVNVFARWMFQVPGTRLGPVLHETKNIRFNWNASPPEDSL